MSACGIIGILSRNDKATKLQIGQALAALPHADLNGVRVWLDRARFGLGYGTVACDGFLGSPQPFHNEDGTIHAAVNGSFYNFERLGKKLQARGHQLSTTSGSEVLVHLYEDCGTGALHLLKGAFAFILWDSKNEVLVAASDQFAKKALYYTVHEEELFVASDINALFAAGVPQGLDHEAAFHALTMRHLPKGRTLFQGVKQVQPGCMLMATRSAMSEIRFGNPSLAQLKPTDSGTMLSALSVLRKGVELAA